MAENNALSDFTTYICNLCRAHVELKHTSSSKHFIELNSNEQMENQRQAVYPLVAMEKLTVSYTGLNDAVRKSRYCEIMFLNKVTSNGDFAAVQAVKDAMEAIAEDFLKKMKIDKRSRLYPFLKCLELSNIELNFIENESINLHGVLLSLNFDLPFIETLEAGRFDDTVLFPPVPES